MRSPSSCLPLVVGLAAAACSRQEPPQPASLVKPALRNDPVIYPPAEQPAKGHYYSTLSEKGEELYADVWSRFKATNR